MQVLLVLNQIQRLNEAIWNWSTNFSFITYQIMKLQVQRITIKTTWKSDLPPEIGPKTTEVSEGGTPVEESQALDSITWLSNSVKNRFSSKMRISRYY